MAARIYLHWTATPYDWVKRGSYHSIVTGDGTLHRLHDYTLDLPAHTWRRNSNAVGIACACMGGIPDPWTQPPTSRQVETMCREVARLIRDDWGWTPDDISVRRIMTHAEAASNRDGWNAHENYGPVAWGGTGERWDFMTLSKGGPDDAGDVLRERIRAFYGGAPAATPLAFVGEGSIRADGRDLATVIDANGTSWAKVRDLLALYDLSHQWDGQQRRILIGNVDVAPRYLANQVQGDIGHPLFEMCLQSQQSAVILVGILRQGVAYCRVAEFAQEFDVTVLSWQPFSLGARRGG